jgi:hypothetical protein
LIRPYAMPISANASAPYLKLAATRKVKERRDAETDPRADSLPEDRCLKVRSLDASREVWVMAAPPVPHRVARRP